MNLPTNTEATDYKSLRLSVGMTATQMAGFLGVTRETISRRETGTMTITKEAWIAITYVCEEAHQVLQSWMNSDMMEDQHDEVPEPSTKKRHR